MEETSAQPATGPGEVGTDLHDPAQRRRVEEALRALPGVVAARVVGGFERPVDELHIVATPDRAPKQVVRDAQSLLFASFGVSTDHRVVSVVQMEGPPAGNEPEARVAITGVVASHHGYEVEVVVRLSDGDRELEGVGRGPASAAGGHRATARATLDAVRPLLGIHQAVEIEGVATDDILGHEIAISFVHFHGSHGTRTVSGSALVRDDRAVAVARSVLDALNRDLEGPREHP